MSLSWKAVRRGKQFCAPACGAGCTYADYLRAKANGEKLAKRLGEGWKARVWENLHWCYCAVSACGRWKVHCHQHKSVKEYTAFLGEPDSGGGYWAETSRSPEAAIRKVRKLARAELAHTRSIVEGA